MRSASPVNRTRHVGSITCALPLRHVADEIIAKNTAKTTRTYSILKGKSSKILISYWRIKRSEIEKVLSVFHLFAAQCAIFDLLIQRQCFKVSLVTFDLLPCI